MQRKALTIVICGTHVGEEVFNLLADNHIRDMVDSVAYNIVTPTDG